MNAMMMPLSRMDFLCAVTLLVVAQSPDPAKESFALFGGGR